MTTNADGCQTTVITSYDAFPDRADVLARYIKDGGRDGRFDLLTVPNPPALAWTESKDLLEQLLLDAMLAITLHEGEQILVATYGDHREIRAALLAEFGRMRERFLRLHPERRLPARVPIEGVDLRELRRRESSPAEPPMAKDLWVGCMDYRQHDCRVPEMVKREFGLDGLPAACILPGGAKDLGGSTPRSRLVMTQISQWWNPAPRNIVLTCHSGWCGAFGGRKGFRDEADEREKLALSLHEAKHVMKHRFPMARVGTAIVRIVGDRAVEVEALSL